MHVLLIWTCRVSSSFTVHPRSAELNLHEPRDENVTQLNSIRYRFYRKV